MKNVIDELGTANKKFYESHLSPKATAEIIFNKLKV